MRKIYVFDSRNKGPLNFDPPHCAEVDWRDDGIYKHTWPDGHTSYTFSSNAKFDLLLDNAAFAFAERNYRETVLTAASSIDSFMDYFIQVTMRLQGHSAEITTFLLKSISSQAERRIGTFLGIRTVLTGREVPYLSGKLIELRNKVAHKGYIPTRDEARFYLCGVTDYILPLYHELYTNNHRLIADIFFESVKHVPPPEGLIGHATSGLRTLAHTLMHPTLRTSADIDDYLKEAHIQRHLR